MVKKGFWSRRNFLLIFLIVFFILLFVWLGVFYSKTCSTRNCFDKNLVSCSKASFISEGDMVFKYFIIGGRGDECLVNVKLLQGDLSNQDSLALVGKEMKCYLPFGTLVVPESSIEDCHGLLKEGLQDLIISKLHKYLVQNFGRISPDLLGSG